MDSMALTNEVAMSGPSLLLLYPNGTSSPNCLMGCTFLHRLPTCKSKLDFGVGPDEFSLLSAWFLVYS